MESKSTIKSQEEGSTCKNTPFAQAKLHAITHTHTLLVLIHLHFWCKILGAPCSWVGQVNNGQVNSFGGTIYFAADGTSGTQPLIAATETLNLN